MKTMRTTTWPVAALGWLLLTACGPADATDLETRTFELSHLHPGEAAALVSPYVYSDRDGTPGSYGTKTLQAELCEQSKRHRRALEWLRKQPTWCMGRPRRAGHLPGN